MTIRRRRSQICFAGTISLALLKCNQSSARPITVACRVTLLSLEKVEQRHILKNYSRTRNLSGRPVHFNVVYSIGNIKLINTTLHCFSEAGSTTTCYRTGLCEAFQASCSSENTVPAADHQRNISMLSKSRSTIF